MKRPLLALLLLCDLFVSRADAEQQQQHDVPTPPSSLLLQRDLDRQVTSLFSEQLPKLPVTMTKDSGNVQVRVQWDGDKMLTFCQAKHVDLHPNAFRDFLINFSKQFSRVNPMAKETIDLHESGGENDDACAMGNHPPGGFRKAAVKTFLKFPFPLSDRVMIHFKYLQLDRSPNEHLLILSERGNEELLKRHWTEQERKHYVLARTFLCAYWIQPVMANGGRVVGSRIQYVFSGDTGGKVPQWLQSAVGPKTAYDSVHGLIRHVSEQQARKKKQ